MYRHSHTHVCIYVRLKCLCNDLTAQLIISASFQDGRYFNEKTLVVHFEVGLTTV